MMNSAPSKAFLKEQIAVQSKLFDSLKGWLKTAMNISTISFVFALFGGRVHPGFQIFGWTALVLSVLAMLVIAYGLKKGRDQLIHLIDLLESRDPNQTASSPETRSSESTGAVCGS